MSLFDELESQASDIIINGDLELGNLYRYDNTEGNADGFNKELKREVAFARQIKIALSRGTTTNGSEYIGTTNDTEIQVNDIVEIVNQRGKKRRWVVTGFMPIKDHTALELDEVRDGS